MVTAVAANGAFAGVSPSYDYTPGEGVQPQDLSGVLLKYVVTYGESELFHGEKRVDMSEGFGGLLTSIFADHYDRVAGENNGCGGALAERYNRFVSKESLIKTSVSTDPDLGGEPRTMLVTLCNPVWQVCALGLTSVRFHLDAVEFCRNVDYRCRIKRLCAYYNAKMMVVFEKMMAAARGYEDRLLEALVHHYGPEPPRSALNNHYRQRLAVFFERHNPSQLAHIERMLHEHSGNEDQLLAGLVAKYGAEPSPPLRTPPPRSGSEAAATARASPARAPQAAAANGVPKNMGFDELITRFGNTKSGKGIQSPVATSVGLPKGDTRVQGDVMTVRSIRQPISR
eukprot:TRINITY_DN28379_c0_g1_i1.p1 TRINITY_DN28379_c0_g1~~TRINITY_DN28379_c0_g1_i1.p1  ORF type:complete len:365 (+),score=60.04 TRINITY_DN28379_c0_g1_i1:74-1096(+)